MLKFGLEMEAFYVDCTLVPYVVPKHIPHDDEGLQLEYRGKPFVDIYEAVYSLLADEQRVVKLLPDNRIPYKVPLIKIPKNTKLESRRLYSKGTINYENIYGKLRHPVPSGYSTAGIHLSVTNELTLYSADSKPHLYNGMWDYVKFFRYLDDQFKQEIKAAKRAPGFYELKSDGRIEYRSLPNNITLNKLIDVISKYKF